MPCQSIASMAPAELRVPWSLMTEQAWKLDHKQAFDLLPRPWNLGIIWLNLGGRATTSIVSHANQSPQHRRLNLARPAAKMLQIIRNITPRLAIFHPTAPSWLLRPFTSTAPAARLPAARLPGARNNPRYRNDEVRIAHYKQIAGYKKTRYDNDPLFREASRQKRRDLHAKRKNDETYQLYIYLKNWLRNHQWVREDLPWKSHIPLLYGHKVEHYCHGCDWTKIGGIQLWWRRKRDTGLPDHHLLKDESESDEYLCHGCYVSKHARFEALPEGYEDVKTFRDLVARKKQFDQVAAVSSSRDTP